MCTHEASSKQRLISLLCCILMEALTCREPLAIAMQLDCIYCIDMRADAFMKDVPPPLGALPFPFLFATPPVFLPFFLLLLAPAPLPSPSC